MHCALVTHWALGTGTGTGIGTGTGDWSLGIPSLYAIRHARMQPRLALAAPFRGALFCAGTEGELGRVGRFSWSDWERFGRE